MTPPLVTKILNKNHSPNSPLKIHTPHDKKKILKLLDQDVVDKQKEMVFKLWREIISNLKFYILMSQSDV